MAVLSSRSPSLSPPLSLSLLLFIAVLTLITILFTAHGKPIAHCTLEIAEFPIPSVTVAPPTAKPKVGAKPTPTAPVDSGESSSSLQPPQPPPQTEAGPSENSLPDTIAAVAGDVPSP